MPRRPLSPAEKAADAARKREARASRKGGSTTPPEASAAPSLAELIELVKQVAAAQLEMATALRTLSDVYGRPDASENVRTASVPRPDASSAVARADTQTLSISEEIQREERERERARALDASGRPETSVPRPDASGQPASDVPSAPPAPVPVPSGTIAVGEMVLTLDAELTPELREIALGGIAGRPVKDPDVVWRKFLGLKCAEDYPPPLRRVRALWTKFCAQEVAFQASADYRQERRDEARKADEDAKGNPAETPRAKAERKAREAAQRLAEEEAAAMTPEARRAAIAGLNKAAGVT